MIYWSNWSFLRARVTEPGSSVRFPKYCVKRFGRESKSLRQVAEGILSGGLGGNLSTPPQGGVR